MARSTTFVIALSFIVLFVGMMWRTGAGNGGRWWAAGWFCLYTGGVAAVLSGSAPVFGPLYPAVGTGFAACLYAGTRRFLRRQVQPELLVAAMAVAAARAFAQPFLGEVATQVTGALVISASALACMIELSRKSPKVPLGAWGKTLRASLPALIVVSAIYAYSRSVGDSSSVALVIWLFGGLLIAVVQSAALLERHASEASRELGALEALLKAIPIGLVLTDNRGTIRTMNESFAKLLNTKDTLGWMNQDVRKLADQIATLLNPHDATELRSHVVEECLRNGAQVAARDLHFRDGRVANASVDYVRDSAGAPIGHLWSVRDVTHETQLQEQLHRARQLETLGRLAGGVAHDFNNKLTTILGNANLVRLELDSDSASQEALADLESAAEYCAELTKDLLDFAQQSPRSLAAIDAVRVISAVANRLRAGLLDSVVLDVQLDDDLPPLLADSTQLERVLTNLVLNARDAVGDGGRISIEARRGLDARNRRIEISVVDDGHGMPAELREHIFDPFFSTKEVGRGSGLGLATVFGIVTSHGGDISVDSSPGKGARFVTTWPIASEAVAPELSSASAAVDGANRRVLVVDDEDSVRRVVEGGLVGAGYHVTTGRSGQEALELCERESFDLFVVDVTMPRMTGEEFVEQHRERFSPTPVLFMSGNLGALKRRHRSSSTIPKPFRIEELVSAAAQALEVAGRAR